MLETVYGRQAPVPPTRTTVNAPGRLIKGFPSAGLEGFRSELLRRNAEFAAPVAQLFRKAGRGATVDAALRTVGHEFSEPLGGESPREVGAAGVFLRKDAGFQFRTAFDHRTPPVARHDVVGRLRRIDHFDVDFGLVHQEPARHRENGRNARARRNEQELRHRIVVADEVAHRIGEIHGFADGHGRDPVRSEAARNAADGGVDEFGDAVGARNRIRTADAGVAYAHDRKLSGTIDEGLAVEREEILRKRVGCFLPTRDEPHGTKRERHSKYFRKVEENDVSIDAKRPCRNGNKRVRGRRTAGRKKSSRRN